MTPRANKGNMSKSDRDDQPWKSKNDYCKANLQTLLLPVTRPSDGHKAGGLLLFHAVFVDSERGKDDETWER